MSLIKQDIDKWLDSVDYGSLSSGTYVPSTFALEFMNFIKLVNGSIGESHVTPPVHLKMLDKVNSDSKYIANLCFRGAAKTTLFMEYLSFYIAAMEYLPGLGKVTGMIYVSDSMENGAAGAKNNMKFRYENSEFLQEFIPHAKFHEGYIELGNKFGSKLGIKLYGAKTGIRGTKIFGKRPTLAILDDLVSDDDAKSKTVMQSIKDTVYKGVNHALDPTKRKVIFNGTPFNKDDILIEAVESGAWDVNVWPVCERFPCSREDFRGAWEDRFSYDYIKEQYELATKTGKKDAFYQELMLRITSSEERLVQDEEIRWYSRQDLLKNKGKFNFYITTDLATSAKNTADYSVISVWAYNSNGDWFWVDGICVRQTVDKSINALFKFVQQYKPVSVGVEVTGQQGAFIQWIQKEMLLKNIWFNFATSGNSNAPGIRPTADKLSRFNLTVPWFKAGKMYFPTELRESVIIGTFMGQIKLTTMNGIKGKDDCIDTISMLAYMNPWKPSEEANISNEDSMWEDDFNDRDTNNSALSNYLV